MSKPSSVLTFNRRFDTEDKCIAYLEKVRWDSKPVCPRCGHEKTYRIATRKVLKCADCRSQFTVRVGTIFEDSKLPLKLWFSAIYSITTARAGISSVELAEKLSVTQKTAWFILQRVQYAIEHKDFQKPLKGNVEVDEFEPLKRKEGKGKRIRIIGMVERGGEARTKVVDNIGHPTITPLVEQNVTKGSTVMTDKWHGYQMIEKAGYTHESVGHRAGEYVRGDVHINTAEGYFGIFQRRIKGIHVHVSAKHLQKYCDMHSYRYNSSKLDPIDRFDAWFQNLQKRLTYKKLIG